MLSKKEKKRKIIGVRLHSTLAERKEKHRNEQEQKLRVPEISFEPSQFNFLVPEIQNYVETVSVKEIKDRVMMWVKLGHPPHIVGPTGCGKTTLALAVAKELGQPTLWINGDDQMTTSDLIGGYSEFETSSLRDRYIHNVVKSLDRTKYSWIDNPLTIACKYGYTLIYNEFSRAKPMANNILLSVLEEGILELPIMFGSDRYIQVHPNFKIILTSNSIEYAGVHEPQDALLDRVVDIYMDYYDFDTEVKIVQKHTGLSSNEAIKIVKTVRTIREKLPEISKPSTRAAIMIGHAFSSFAKYSNQQVMQVYIDVMASKIYRQDKRSKVEATIEDVVQSDYGSV